MSDDYEIGYGRPPKAHDFRKGRSGNPQGSSRKVRQRKRRQVLSFDELILEDAEKPIRIREGNRTSTISMKEGLLRKQYALGLSGNRLALKHSLEQIAKAEQSKLKQVLEVYEVCLDYKENYPARAKYHHDRGRGPLLPHADDMQLDPYTGEMTITGPRNVKELAKLKQILEAKKFVMTEIEGLRADFEECARAGYPPSPSDLEIVSRFESLVDRLDSELSQRGWLPRLAGDKEPKAN